jgi:hypothetical protein
MLASPLAGKSCSFDCIFVLDATLIPCSYDNDKNYILELYQKIGYNKFRE